MGTIVPLLPADVHSLLLLSQATLLALDWWTNLSASSSLSRSKGLLLQSYCGQMLARQVWGGEGRGTTSQVLGWQARGVQTS